jgi:tetratricopeptide (TPR) repeat protein
VKKPVKIILLIIAGLIFIALMLTLVWGKTIRMASANQLFAAKDLTNQTKAVKIYEDMAVDEPNSPFVLHNLGLGQYKQGKFDQAASSLQKALKAFEGVKLSPEFVKRILHRFLYHFGNAVFKLAVLSEKNQSNQSGQSNQPGQSGQTGQQSQPVQLYQAALESYQKAIEANPDDLDAKYNYELTRLRIKGQEQQNQNQPSQDQKDQKGQKDQKDQQQSGNQQNQQNQNQQQQANQSQADAEQKQGQMSKEEAEALLKMAEKGDQYQGQVIFGADNPTAKDW